MQQKESIQNIGIICNDCTKTRSNFWQEKYGKIDLSNSYVKFPFKQGKRVEHMWVEIKKDDGKKTLVGVLNNDPVLVTRLKCGDVVRIKRSQIEQHINENLDPISSHNEAVEYIKYINSKIK